jgi:FkbM family methyltransferase
VEPLFDVSSFTVKGQYFAHVPYEPGATEALLRILEPGCVFVDVGANAGYFTVLAGLRVGPSGRVVAFEPNPAVRAQLRHHVAINGITDRVAIEEVALADRDDDGATFFVSCWADNDGISSLTPSSETMSRGGLRHDATIRVPVRRFDTWAATTSLSRVDLMKIDVEGAECQVLNGMMGMLDRTRPRHIICETMPDGGAVAFLLARGYAFTMLDEIRGGIPNLLFTRGNA